MRYQAFFALSTIYILMDDLDKAKKEAEGLIANDYDSVCLLGVPCDTF